MVVRGTVAALPEEVDTRLMIVRHHEAFTVVLLSGRLPPIIVNEWAIWAELRIGSFVMILIVPAIADEPNKAEPPPRITSTRSIKIARGQLDGILRMIEEDRYCWTFPISCWQLRLF